MVLVTAVHKNGVNPSSALSQVQADGADDGCVTFVLHDEDHTLGNALRYMIMKKYVLWFTF